MDRQLLRQVDASALFCCDIIQDFKGSKAQTVKIPFFHSSRKWKNSLSLIYENISSEEAAKQRAKRENSKIRHRQHADKEANETVLKENRSQGEQEVTQRLILHSTDVLTASWFTTVRQNTSDADSTKKYGAEKRNEVQEEAYEAKKPPQLYFKYLLFQQQFYQSWRKSPAKNALHSAETAQEPDSAHKQPGMQSL